MNNAAQIKILKHFLKNKEDKFTINQLSKELKINYRIAYEQTIELGKEELIKIDRIGKANYCSLTNKFNEKIFVAEYQRRKELFKKNKDFQIITKRFSEQPKQLILLLFGSYAKNKATEQSDMDILAISENEKELRQISELIPKNIHLTIIKTEEFLEMTKLKKLTVVSEAIKNNIILLGIEDYYRLLNL